MEQIKELEEVLELLNTKQYTKLRQYLAELNDADIAGLLEELEEEDMLKVRNLGRKSLDEVIARLESFGLGLKLKED